MSEESDRFRRRAIECRRLADNARTYDDRDSLLEMARDLDEEADRIEAEEG